MKGKSGLKKSRGIQEINLRTRRRVNAQEL